MASELEMNKSGGTETQGDTSLDADIHRIHSQIELLLEGLRIDGNSSASHSIVQAIQDGEPLESVLSIATELVMKDGKKNQKP